MRAIYAGDAFVMFLTEADAAHEGVAIEGLEELRKLQIQESISFYKHDRTSAAFTKGILFYLLWTVTYVIFLLGLGFLQKIME